MLKYTCRTWVDDAVSKVDATVSAFTSYSVVDSLLLYTNVTHTSPIRGKRAAEAETSEYIQYLQDDEIRFWSARFPLQSGPIGQRNILLLESPELTRGKKRRRKKKSNGRILTRLISGQGSINIQTCSCGKQGYIENQWNSYEDEINMLKWSCLHLPIRAECEKTFLGPILLNGIIRYYYYYSLANAQHIANKCQNHCLLKKRFLT